MQRVLSTDSIKKCEQQAIDSGVTEIELMWRAANAVFESVEWKAPVAVVCGAGNNAGDGYALACILHDNDIDCKIFLTTEKFSVSGKHYFEMARQKGVEICHADSKEKFESFSMIVDCIFGTGYSGRDMGDIKMVVNNINQSPAKVISVDINSGLVADSGMTQLAVHSDLTVSIGSFKYGHFLNMAKDVLKSVKNCDIGLPDSDEPTFLIEEQDAKLVLKKRKNFSNKGNFGYISLICGSKMYSGASKLANLAASSMVSGAGVVKLAVPESLSDAVLPYLLESTLYPLSDSGGNLTFDSAGLSQLMATTDTIAFGMGVGVNEETQKILKFLLSNFDKTLILDADALNCLATIGTDCLKSAKCKLILTPHAKEFSRLTGLSVEEILNAPVQQSKEFAKAHGCILLLKGATTIVTDGTTTLLVSRGCPGMATAGSGDVLSGVLSAVCGYNSDNLLLATSVATLISGVAGELAVKMLSE